MEKSQVIIKKILLQDFYILHQIGNSTGMEVSGAKSLLGEMFCSFELNGYYIAYIFKVYLDSLCLLPDVFVTDRSTSVR